MAGDLSPIGPGGERAAPDKMRASHGDRDRIVELLRTAAGDGRLTAAELDDRLEAALSARTYGELAALTRDLPEAPGFIPVTPVPQPKDVVRIECGSGSIRRDGRWVVPRRMEIELASGSVKLDFTHALISSPVLRIDAHVRSGSLTLITMPGIVVDADEVGIRSGRVKVRTPWDTTVTAVLRIEISGMVSSGSVRARPPRRTFWQWLRRRPRPYALPRS